MIKVGKRIKELRKNKGKTQEQFAEILSVSFQTVSKWETGATSPDIELLPVIAEYFGISIDELFGYKANTLQFKERVIKFMVDNGAFRFGDFSLNSKRKSPYYINIKSYKSGAQIAKLGEFFAEYVRMNDIQSDVILGTAYNGQALAVATAMALFYKHGIDMEYCFWQNTKQGDSVLNGKQLVDGDTLTLLCDTITTGESLRETMAKVRSRAKVEVKNIIIMVDRQERGRTLTSIEELEQELGAKIYSIVTIDDIVNAIENKVIGGKEYIERIKAYRAAYSGKKEMG